MFDGVVTDCGKAPGGFTGYHTMEEHMGHRQGTKHIVCLKVGRSSECSVLLCFTYVPFYL